MKLKTLLLLPIFLLCSISMMAQFPSWGGGGGKKIKGKITGQLVDSLSAEKVGYATISLRRAKGKKIIDGVLSDENGKFKFEKISTGDYKIEISFLGYDTKMINDIELTLKAPDNDLGQIGLAPSNYVLDEVQITEKRALIENKVDKIVYNAEDDSSVAGGDATEVLRKVPILSVDLDGNVSIRGSQNVRILVNGKPSGMFSANTADALKMFPADQIKKVEVITAPGAKYDGEGGAGIINIITKKENIEGVAGTVSGSVGNRQNNANLNLNIGKGRFGFSTNSGMFYSVPVDATNEFTRTSLADGSTLFSNTGITNTSRLGFNGSASAFYDLNAYNSFNTSVTYRGFGFDTDSDYNFFNPNFNVTGNNRVNNLYSGLDWNTDYTRSFEDNDKRELTFAVQVSQNTQDQDNFVTDFLTGTDQLFRNENIRNKPDNLELTGQIDYVQPIGKSKTLEVGTKAVLRNIDSNSEFYLFNQGSGEYDQLDEDRTNNFIYDQDVYSGYASLNFTVKKFSFVTGLRYERTEIQGRGDQEAQNFSDGYDNLLPNIAVSRSLKNFRTIKISYSERIQRPGLRFINPFVNTTDLGNIQFGNPTLSPELTKQIELSYNTNVLGFTIFSSAYYKRNSDIIESVANLVDGVRGITTFSNVGINNSVGVNFFTSKSVGKFTLRGGGDVYTYDANGVINGQEVSNSALSYRLFTNGEFAISGTIKADFFGFFQAPQFTLQGENASFSIMGIGARKDFKNSSLGIRIIEPFFETKSFNSDITGDGFRQIGRFNLPFRSIGINFRYKFGKVDFRERKSKIKNNDQKDGGGDGQGGGGGQGGVGGQG